MARVNGTEPAGLEPREPIDSRPNDVAAPEALQPHASPDLNPSSLRVQLAYLLNHLSHAPAEPPTPPDVLSAIDQCMQHISSPGGATPSQTGAFLSALTASGLMHRADVIATCAGVMRTRIVRLDWSPPSPSADSVRCDIVGTGGDGQDTFNVSTTAALVAAGAFEADPLAAPRRRVMKHGNRASSSTSGSADLLMALDVPLASLPPASLPPLAHRLPFTFLFAPLFHPSLASLAPLRKELGFPTVFNLLGPLLNPSSPQRMILGVARPSLGPTFASALQMLGGIQRAWVVCGHEGLDECSIAGPTKVWEVAQGREKVRELDIVPEDFGLQRRALSDVAGGRSAAENAQIVLRLFGRSGTADEDLGPIRDFVLLNAAALLVVSGAVPDDDLVAATALARRAMESGSAQRALDSFRVDAQRQLSSREKA